MILEFKVSNMYSIFDEVSLNFQAANLRTWRAKSLEKNVFRCGDEELLKSIAIYGANASGKSSLIKALTVCIGMIVNSHLNNQSTTFPFVPFKFGGNNKGSSFYVRFLMNEIEYEYSFTFTPYFIVKEALYYYPKGRRVCLFERDENRGPDKHKIYKFNKSVTRPWDVALNTSDKTLFVSRGSQMDRGFLKDIYNLFSENIVVLGAKPHYPIVNKLDTVDKKTLLSVLYAADSDIVDFYVSNGELYTIHRGYGDVSFNFLKEESDGTIKLFGLAEAAIDAVRNGKLLIIDELDASMHPQLAEFIVNLFHKSENAQMIFVSHNPYFLDLCKLRRDQIYFVNKKQDGASDVYSLYDFKHLDEDLPVAASYLQGRFDAIPYLGSCSINAACEPQEYYGKEK